MASETETKEYTVELTSNQLLKVRIALINTAKEWEDNGDSETAQDFRDVLKPFAFDNNRPHTED